MTPSVSRPPTRPSRAIWMLKVYWTSAITDTDIAMNSTRRASLAGPAPSRTARP